MEKNIRENKIVAFIPLRGESKRIHLKNIKKIAGKPLAFWTIDSALNCTLINEVIVSTESEVIRNTIEKIRNEKLRIIKRSQKTVRDTASTEFAMIEFAQKYNFDYIVLIQATSPLLNYTHLEEGIKRYFKAKCDSLLSVVRQKRFIWGEEGGTVNPVNYNPLQRPRSQDFEGFLVENGAFYITSRRKLLRSKCRVSGKICAYEMGPESYFEVDDPHDWKVVECLLEQEN